MTDPFEVFKAGTGGRQNTLKTIWPDLYDSLARVEQAGAARAADNNLRRCVLAAHPLGAGPPAVGRVGDKYGHTACRACIDKVHGPGHPGFPIKIERP
jgi:hypothetical protein